jgi:hypothetical protein
VSWSLPYSRRRRYLTGADWLVGMLDHMTRQACGVGNTSQVVLEITGSIPEEALRAGLTTFLARLPFLSGSPARDLNLAPYWRPGAASGGGLPLTLLRLPEDADPASLERALASGLDRAVGGGQRLAFLCIAVGPRRCYLAMAFDHWLLDGRGAEMLLALLLAHLHGQPIDDRLAALAAPEPAHLDRWRARHHAGRRVIAHLAWLREGRAAVLPRPRTLAGSRSHFAFVCFQPDDTRKIVDAAYREAGYLMLQSFVLAAVLQALHPFFCSRQPTTDDTAATDYVVPVSVDMRPLRGADTLVFFNHLSFVLFRLPMALVQDRALLAARIRDQMVGQVKAGLPQDVADASTLLRILPLPVLSRLARLPMRGEFGSFSFAQLASAAPPQPWRGRVTNLFHMPRIPVPPGFGVVANQFEGRLNLVLSAHEAIVTPTELAGIAEGLRRLPRSCDASDSTAAFGTRPATATPAVPRPA